MVNAMPKTMDSNPVTSNFYLLKADAKSRSPMQQRGITLIPVYLALKNVRTQFCLRSGKNLRAQPFVVSLVFVK